MTATLAPGILPALVWRFFLIQDVSADRCPSSALGQTESNTRSNGTIRVIRFCIKRLSTPLFCDCRSGRGEESSGENVLRLIQIRVRTPSFEKISPVCQVNSHETRGSTIRVP